MQPKKLQSPTEKSNKSTQESASKSLKDMLEEYAVAAA
jgi:hypothetical protein